MQRVIFDCDNTMGLPFKEVDDGLALLYLLGSPAIDLLAVTTTFGNGNVDQAYTLTRKMLTHVGRADIPVYRGAERRDAPPADAAYFLAETAAAHPGEISLLATGPLGNLRCAAELDAHFFANLKQIVCMGGYLAPLRIGEKEVAELNLSADPWAAYEVLHAGCPVTLMNAQVCLPATMCKDDIAGLTFWPYSVRRVLARWLLAFGRSCGTNEFYLWDLLPAVYLSHPGLFEEQYVDICSSVTDLGEGLLFLDTGDDASSSVNMPARIDDVECFKEILWAAWSMVAFR